MPSDVSAQSAITGLSSDSVDSSSPFITQNSPQGDDEQLKMFDFPAARIHLRRIIDDWNTEIEDTEVRRKTRKLEIDTEGLRQKNDIDEDETIIPIRLIHSNIVKEQPPYINYIKNSRRISIFECIGDPLQDNDLLEQSFTRAATYSGWEKSIFKCLDGSQAHGWDAIEVVYDESKPGHFALEHLGHDQLLFPRSARDLQQCPRIVRCYDVTMLQLRKWVKTHGFEQSQVDLILKTRKETTKENETIRIYKLYFKSNSEVEGVFKQVVQVSWFCLTDGVTDWLKQPTQFYCGVDEQKQMTSFLGISLPPTWSEKAMELYPIFILPYQLTEEGKIVDCKGRGFLDEAKQEALTSLWSSYINSSNRASNVYASPSQEDGTGASLKEIEDILLKNGRVFNRPLTFWHMDYPSPDVLKTLQYADVANDQENGQTNFAAMNREDSRKTAREVSAAQQQQQLLNSVQLTLFSTFIRDVYSFAWLIVQSQALQNKIQFLLKATQVPGPAGQPTMVWQNDIEVISKNYNIRAAGDVDVVLKQELEQKFQQDWEIISQTPLASTFLIDYVKMRYPDRADKYMSILQQSDQINQMKQLTGGLANALEGIIKDNPADLQKLPPQQIQQLQQMIQQGKSVIQQQNTQQ